MTTIILDEALSTLQERLLRLEAALPVERTTDEQEALAAMATCARELRRMALLVESARQSCEAATNAKQEQSLNELHRLLHDLRTPAGVLYAYLHIIADGQMFVRSTPAQRSEALHLSALVCDIREQA